MFLSLPFRDYALSTGKGKHPSKYFVRAQRIKSLFPLALGKIVLLHLCDALTITIITVSINAMDKCAVKGYWELFQFIATWKCIYLKPQHIGDTHSHYPWPFGYTKPWHNHSNLLNIPSYHLAILDAWVIVTRADLLRSAKVYPHHCLTLS